MHATKTYFMQQKIDIADQQKNRSNQDYLYATPRDATCDECYENLEKWSRLVSRQSRLLI